MSRRRDAEALVRQVFGSDDDSSDGGTPSTSEFDLPPPARFLAPDRERHVVPLADSISGLHLARGALTREAQAWLDKMSHHGIAPDAVSFNTAAPRVAKEVAKEA